MPRKMGKSGKSLMGDFINAGARNISNGYNMGKKNIAAGYKAGKKVKFKR